MDLDLDRDAARGRLVRRHLDMLLLATIGDGHAYGYGLVQELKRRSGGKISLRTGSVYPPLHRLWQNGYLSREREVVDCRPRLTYRLTDSGHELLARQRDEWDEVQAAVDAAIAGFVARRAR